MKTRKLNSIDLLFISVLLILFTAYLVLIFSFFAPGVKILPFEDTLMLLRYADHFAQGQGITWNTGESPVDGCTDFLLVIVLAALIKLGLSPENSSFLISSFSHFALVLLVYFTIRKLYQRSPLPAIISSLLVAFGPGILYVNSLWGTPFFALLGGLTWYFALKIIQGNHTLGTALCFSFAGLLTGLVRPEGVFLVLLIFLAILYYNGLRCSKYLIWSYIIIYVVFGGAYFAWHWSYFGYPLPNTFYRKGGGLYFDGLLNGIKNTFIFSLPTLPFILRSLLSRKNLQELIFVLIPIIGFTSLWILISPEMNFIGRFQYTLYPIFLMSWPLISGQVDWSVNPFYALLKRYKYVAIFSTLVIVLALSIPFVKIVKSRYTSRVLSRDGRHELALLLKKFDKNNYTMAVSEAGHLPYYSGWKAVDTWGLNDKWIAHHDLISDEFLDNFKPELIMFHAEFPFESSQRLVTDQTVSPRNRKWIAMTRILNNYAIEHGYILAAAYGVDSSATHYYYVKPDFPDSKKIVNTIRNLDYYWVGIASKCRNFVSDNAVDPK